MPTQLHVITLPERKKLLIEEMDRMSIDYVIWPATIHHNTKTAISNSYKKIIRWAKDNNLSEITIAEDDILFTSKNGWNYYLQNKPEDFDLYLGGHYSGIHHPGNIVKSFTGLTLVTISNRFFDKILSANEVRNIDTEISRIGGIFKVCTPEVAKQRIGYSFNRKRIVNDDHYLEGREFLKD